MKLESGAPPITSVEQQQPEELHPHIRARGLISDAALGLADGLVTNLSFLAGFAGALSDISIIRLAGTAAMLAGAVSMFFGGVLSARSERDLYNADSAREAYEIEHEPEEEKLELKNFYLEKGLDQEEATSVVNKISSNKKKWLNDILLHELHLHEGELRSPYKVGAVIGAAFLVGAFIPLTAYFVVADRRYSILISGVVSIAFLFLAGFWDGRIAGKNALRKGLETVLIGVVAAVILYLIGTILVFV